MLFCEELNDFLKGMGFSSSLRVWMWMRSSRLVGAKWLSMLSWMNAKLQQSWVRSQHPPTQWNLRGSFFLNGKLKFLFINPGFWTRTRRYGSMHRFGFGPQDPSWSCFLTPPPPHPLGDRAITDYLLNCGNWSMLTCRVLLPRGLFSSSPQDQMGANWFPRNGGGGGGVGQSA